MVLGVGESAFPEETAAGREMRGSQQGIEWTFAGHRHRFVKETFRTAYPTHEMQGIVVIFRADKEYDYPENAVILNADSTVRCRIIAPRQIVKCEWGGAIIRLDQAFWAKGAGGRVFTALAMTLGTYSGTIDSWVSDFYEERELNIHTGECGTELVGSGRW
jgi:hypothetical protein